MKIARIKEEMKKKYIVIFLISIMMLSVPIAFAEEQWWLNQNNLQGNPFVNLWNAVWGNADSIVELEANAVALESNITTLETEIMTLEAKIAILEMNVTVMNAKIIYIEECLANLTEPTPEPPPEANLFTIGPTDDAWTSINPPNPVNYGWSSVTWVGHNTSGSYRTCIKFDVNELLLLNPNPTIINASVRIYYYTFQQNSPIGRSIAIYRNTQNFDEGELIGNNLPSHITNTADTEIFDGYGWMEFDITSDIQSWIKGEYLNYGHSLQFTDETGPYCIAGFRTKEYGTYIPELVVYWFPE